MLPFEWSAFMGTSWDIMEDFLRITNMSSDWFAPSYPVRAQTTFGYPAYSDWHTVFPWFASDFTFIGALIIIVLFVYMFAKAWRQVIEEQEFFSIILCSNMAIFFLHIVGTNHMMIRRNTLVEFFLAIILWLFLRSRKTSMDDISYAKF